MTPLDFIRSFTGSIRWTSFPPKCILNEFLVSEIELYDIINNPNKSDRLFTNKELEFRKGNIEFSIDDIFYAYNIEDSNQLTIEIADYEDWKNRHQEWCKNHRGLQHDINIKIRNAELEEENAQLKEKVSELENILQLETSKIKKDDPREVNSLLKIIDASLHLGKVPRDRALAGNIARKIELLYEDGKLSEKTIRDKINKIDRLKE